MAISYDKRFKLGKIIREAVDTWGDKKLSRPMFFLYIMSIFKKLKLRTKLISAFIVVSALILVLGLFSVYQLNNAIKPLEGDIPSLVQDTFKKSSLDDLAKSIKYYDEVLTQAARNFAFTQDKKWKQIYNDSVPTLDLNIKEVLEAGDEQDIAYFSEINSSNTVLVKMEKEAIVLVDQGKAKDAVVILESKEYWDQKNIYKAELNKYLERRSSEKNKSISSSLDSLELIASKSKASFDSIIVLLVFLSLGLFLIASIFSIFFALSISGRLEVLKETTKEIARGNLEKRIKISSKDEIGELAESFNEMASKLADIYKSLEEKVRQRTKDVEEKNNKLEVSEAEIKKVLAISERTNKLMVGRELKMKEMKKRIEELEGSNSSLG